MLMDRSFWNIINESGAKPELNIKEDKTELVMLNFWILRERNESSIIYLNIVIYWNVIWDLILKI